MNETWVVVGKITHAHGIRGEVFFFPYSGEAQYLSEIDSVQIGSDNFNLKSFRAHKKGFILVLKEINNRNLAEEMKGKELKIPEESLQTQEGDNYYLYEIEGFTVYDGDENLGPIVGFSTNTVQDLLVIELNNKKIEIPYVEDFIKEVVWEDQKIIMELPEGLYEK